ncbi:armadillo-type protein [Ephemerocybe angulata]|uniref:Armadillo-type protein n=1 Tax=Ephemerocybe angulata TaxID=980116 RepID=A0A8H6I8L2_9AGAR|nr:armadillo-type protein [Tulosesus angulatus]
MFKGILPSKRSPSMDFTVLTQLADVPPGKENLPNNSPPTYPVGKPPKSGLTLGKKKKSNVEAKKQKEQKDKPLDVPETEEAFDRLLDDLQIPPTLRPKLLGMDAGVKAAMLKSSHMVSEKLGMAPATISGTPPRNTLRRVHSTESLGSPRAAFMNDAFEPPRTAGLPSHVSAQTAHQSPYGGGRSFVSRHASGASVDVTRLFSKSHVNLGSSSNLDLALGLGGKVPKDKNGTGKNLSPMRFCSILQGQSSLQIDIEDIKKLRLMLRNESASWTEEFYSLGGYSALLTRLNEVLEVEWREEQHDDQALHELLRCFKALSTSAIGCFALRSSSPTPYAQLITLLYSDKKPGDVATRQLIVDLLLLLFDLYPPSALPSNGKQSIGRHREAWESRASVAATNVITLPVGHKSLFSFIRSLLLTPAPPPAEAPGVPVSPHEFIESLHVPRVYKTYLQEMSDVCRDYFWVFCHPNNTIWVLAETDESRVEKPKAPSGMTGGVEFEAMCYFTTHLRFINAIAATVADLKMPKEHELSAYRFHSDLFLSGLERIILISRKASTTYYPTLHLELSRYVNHALNAGYEFPYTVSRLIGLPPVALAKNQTQPLQPPPRHASGMNKRSMGPPSTPPRRSNAVTAAATQGPSTNLTSYLNAPPPPPALGLPTTWKAQSSRYIS